MGQKIEVHVKGITVKILPVRCRKGRATYHGYRVPDYSSGKRKLPTFSDLEAAKRKARAVAQAKAAGQQSLSALAPQEREIHAALEAVAPTGTRIDKAAMIFADAVKFVSVDEILVACRAWRDNSPGKKFSPKLVETAIMEFSIRQDGRISERRLRTNGSYLGAFKKIFGKRYLHEVSTFEIADWSSAKKWSRRTRNDVLGTVSLFYKDCVQRHYAINDPASGEAIRREKLRGSNIEILMPEQARKLLSSVDDCLRAFLALWMFSGARKEEAGRITWEQVEAGLQSGSIHIRADQSKTGEARSLPITDNLRAWLMAYRRPIGTVLPAEWQGMQRIDDLANTLARQSKTKWVANGPRHSFGTFHLKLHGDPVSTLKAMGTSVHNLQKHYCSRSDAVTKEVATEWFNIFPNEAAEIIPIPLEQPGSAISVEERIGKNPVVHS
jgi:hypothetical protein